MEKIQKNLQEMSKKVDKYRDEVKKRKTVQKWTDGALKTIEWTIPATVKAAMHRKKNKFKLKI
jgi:hypothetical protein